MANPLFLLLSMREYKVKEWQRSVETIQNISIRKNYVRRFRLEYFHAISGKTSLNKLLINLLGFFSNVRYIYLNQVTKRRKLPVDAKLIFPISDSPSFLKTVLPLLRGLLEKGLEPTILCPANHYNKLKNSLSPDLAERLIIFEQVDIGRSLLTIHLAVLGSFFASLWDMIWMLFQPVEKKLASSSGYGRYAMTSHYFGRYWHHFFEGRKRTLVAANDYWFWESLLFTAAESSSSESIVLQHGKLSDLYYPMFAKHFFAWGQADKDIMITQYGAEPEEILVTGSSYFDSVYKHFSHLADENHQRKEQITFLSQPFQAHAFAKQYYEHALEWFYALAVGRPLNKLAIKLHPFDKASFYVKRPTEIVIADQDIFSTMQHSSMVIFFDSTASYEAAMAGVVSIQCLEEGAMSFNDQSESGLAIRVKSKEELREIVSMLINDTAFYQNAVSKSRMALDYYFANLGNADEAIISELL